MFLYTILRSYYLLVGTILFLPFLFVCLLFLSLLILLELRTEALYSRKLDKPDSTISFQISKAIPSCIAIYNLDVSFTLVFPNFYTEMMIKGLSYIYECDHILSSPHLCAALRFLVSMLNDSYISGMKENWLWYRNFLYS